MPLIRTGGAMGDISYFIDWFPQKPVELRHGTVYRIGRGPNNDFFLPDEKASRLHAEIEWNGRAFVLRDLGSANGTTVGGEKVIEHVLKPKDEIRIGHHVLTFRVEDTSSLDATYRQKEKEVQQWQTVVGRPGPDIGLSGTLAEIALSQIVQMFDATRKTGRLAVRSGDRSGAVWFRDGRVVAAESDAGGARRLDHEAFYEIVGWEEGSFEFFADQAPPEARMADAVQGLLMEAARRLDEKARGR